jgi:alpha/beta superfamily hydrolase
MFNPLFNGIADRLSPLGIGILRFQFRGVGDSTGAHGGGVDEVADVAAAVEEAATRARRIVVGGWSFGAAVALGWLATGQAPLGYVGVAPYLPLVPDPATLPHVPALIVLGARDQVVDAAAGRALASAIGAHCTELDSDHFFVLKDRLVADAIVEWLATVD